MEFPAIRQCSAQLEISIGTSGLETGRMVRSWPKIPSRAGQPKLVIRIGRRLLPKAELRDALLDALVAGLERDVSLLEDGVTSAVDNTQANSFRGAKASPIKEHDFCFEASE